MKRSILILFVITLALSVTAFGLAEQTNAQADIMARIVAANHLDNLTSLFGSLQMNFTKDDPDFNAYANDMEYIFYADSELLYTDGENSQQIEYAGGERYDTYNGYLGKYLFLDSAPEPYDRAHMLLSASSVNERVIQVETKAGETLVTTEMTYDELCEMNPDYQFNEEIAKCVCTYTVDTQTLALSSLVSTYTLADGTVKRTNSIVSFSVPRPEMAQTLWDHAHSEDVRVCTLIIEPGTPAEYTVTTEVQKGDYVFPTADATIEMYDDAACTIAHQTSDPNTDMKVYIKLNP